MRNFNHVYIVSSDKLRNLITGNQQDLSCDQIMWKMFYELPKIYSLDKESIVIMDATAIEEKYRIDSNKEIKTYFDEIILVYFEIPKEIIDKQNLNRDFPLPQEIVDTYFNKFQKPTENDVNFFNKIYKVTTNNFEEIAEKL
jgi:tRNA uridine 5-carbamoylmethylation protein Kti12